MIKITNSKFNGKNGFTLIEMLIVIAIIGILASIVLVGLGAFRSRGRDTRRIADLREAQGGLELYFSKFSKYPDLNGWNNMASAIVAGGVGVTSIPNDPLFPTINYDYVASSDKQQYVLRAKMEDVNHPALKDDLDGAVLGGDCVDPWYCVSL